MCNFPTIKDAADVAIATMHSGIQVSASDWIQALNPVSWLSTEIFFFFEKKELIYYQYHFIASIKL